MSSAVQSSYSKALGNWTNGSQHRHGLWFLVLLLLAVAGMEVPAWAQSCSVSISLNPSAPVAGQSVTFTANVQGVPPVDNDNASVTLDGSALCSTPGQQGLQCSATVNNISAGTHTLGWSCSFNGTGGNGSNSGSQQFTVSPAPTPTPTPTPSPTPTPTPTPTPFPTGPGTLNPKFVVLSVIYAPPGSSSSVDYGSSTAIGTSSSLTQSVLHGNTINASLQIGPKILGTGSTITANGSDSFSQTRDTSTSIVTNKTTSADIVVPGPTNSLNGINHDYDVILVWINPVVNLNVLSSSSAEWSGFSFDSNDPAGEVDVIPLYVKWLKNPSTMPPGVTNALARTWAKPPADGSGAALTPNDFAIILARDPFANGSTTIDPARFDLTGQTFSYAPPPNGGQPLTQKLTLSYETTSTLGQTAQDQYTNSFSVQVDTSVAKFISATFKDTTTTTWTTSATQTATQTQGQTATLNLTDPTGAYTGPTDLLVYQDNVYGTFMFAFVPENQAPDFTLFANPVAKNVTLGSSATFTVTASALNGFTGTIALSASGLPAGCGPATFAPASMSAGGSSTMTVPNCSTAGSSTITITGTSGSLTHTASVNLQVSPAAFAIAVFPPNQAVIAGGSTTYTVANIPTTGFNGNVTLGVTGLPSGASFSFSPASIAGPGSSTLTINTTSTVATGLFSITVTGTSGSTTQSATANFFVNPPAVTPATNPCSDTLMITPQSPASGAPVTIQVQPSTPPGAALTVTGFLDGVQFCSNFNSGCAQTFPNLSEGGHIASWSCSGNGFTTSSGVQPFTVGLAPDVGSINPKYVVLSVIYAPPGQASNVDYGSSTLLGTSTSISDSFSDKNTLTVSVGVGVTIPPFSAKVTVTDSQSFTQTATTTSSVAVNKTTTSDIKVPGPKNAPDGIDHNFDVVLVWINPVMNFKITGPHSVQVTGFSFDSNDPANEMDVVPLYVGWLKNPSTMPPGIADLLARPWAANPIDGSGPGLTSADFQAILARDPFSNPAYVPTLVAGGTTTTDNRFDLVLGKTLSYEPAPAGGQPVTEKAALSYQNTSTLGLTATDQYSVGYSINFSVNATIPIEFFALNLSASVMQAQTLTWTNSATQTATKTGMQTSTLLLTGPTSTYNGPTEVQVFQDNVYGTFMFVFNPDTQVQDFSLFASPDAQNATAGSTASYQVSALPLNGFNGSVSLSATVSPSGCGAVTFTPASITSPTSSKMQLSCSTLGTYTITITGTSGSLTHTTTATLVVTPAPFLLFASPATQAVVGAGSTTYNVSNTAIAGFNGTISLSASGPAGTTLSFNPSSIAAGGTSVLTATTSSSTPTGTPLSITITGTSGTTSQTATVGLYVSPPPQPPGTVPCTVNIVTTPSTPSSGQPTSFTATVNGIPPADNASETVKLDGQQICSVSNGPSNASCSAPGISLSSGTHALDWSCTDVSQHSTSSGTQIISALPQGSINPKYLVLSVIYAPPGQKSSVDYNASTVLGTTTSLSQSFTAQDTLSASLKAGLDYKVPGNNDPNKIDPNPSGGINSTLTFTQSISQSLQGTASIGLTKTQSSDVVVSGPQSSTTEGINHDYDVVLLWLNPVANITMTDANHAQWGGFNFDAADPVNDLEIVPVYVAWLKNPALMPPGVAFALARTWADQPEDGSGSALTATDFTAILARDPFANGSTGIDPTRFSLTGETFAYAPAPNGGQPFTEKSSFSYQTTTQQSQTLTDTYQVGFSVKATDAAVKNFVKSHLKATATGGVQNNVTLTLTDSTVLQSTQTTGQTATLSLVGPSSAYTGPTDLQVYQDNIYGTFLFAFVPEVSFNVSVAAPVQSANPGGSATYAVSTTAINTFSGVINFSTTGLPSTGVTATFSPASLNGAGSTTLTVSPATTLAPGIYPFMIVGTVTNSAGTETHVANATLVVTPTASFTLSVSPAAVEVVVGNSAQYTVSTSAAGGFNSTVSLSAAGLPAGATYSFNPTSITGAGSSTLTVTPASSTAPNNYQLTVTGTSGLLTQTASTDVALAGQPTTNPPVGTPCGVNVAMTPATPIFGQPTTFQATITQVPPVNNWNLTTTIDGQTLCGPTTSSCSVTRSDLSPGPHTIGWSCTDSGTAGSGSGSGTVPITVAGHFATGNLNPKYVVLSVIYTPPGQKSTVDYGSSTNVGTSTSFTGSFSATTGLTISLGPPQNVTCNTGSGVVCGSGSGTFTQALSDAKSIAIKKAASFDIQVPGLANPADGINHDYDIILLWINPIVNFQVTGNASAQIPGYSFDPRDPANEVDVVPVYVKWLKNPTTMPAAIADALGRLWALPSTDGSGPGLTTADYQAILARDPFTAPGYTLTLASGTNTTTDGRFDLEAGETFSYEPPPDAGQPITEKFSIQYQNTSTKGQGTTDSYSVGFGIEGETAFTNFITGNINNSNSLSFMSKVSTQSSSGSTQTASLSLVGPCVGYTGPTDVQVYQDNVYGTFMFAFVANSQAPDFSLCATPSPLTVNTGAKGTYTVFTSPSNGFSGSVALTVSGLPSGVLASFSPSTITGTATSTLTITVPPSAAAGTFLLTITGTSGTLTHTTTVSLVINTAPAFSLSATPTSQSVNTGITANTTVSTAAFNGFTGTVNLSASVSPSTGCNAPSFTPASISGSATSTMKMTCSAAGTYTATITGTSGSGSNALTQTAQVTLIVTAAPVANLTPPSLSFASQSVGTSSGPQTLTLSNSGTAALSITSIAASGDFSQTNTCGTSVAVGGSCTISVSFAPSATGARSGTLTVTDNAAGSPHTASLSGTGIAPAAGLSPASLTFAGQNVGTTSAAQTVTLTNSGTAALTITSIAASGNFAQTNNCGTTLAVNGSCTISVTFTPSASGTRTGTLSITDNAVGSPQTASLTGTGLAPAAALSPTSLTFSSQNVGTTSAAQAVTLTNSGNIAMTISGITISGDFAQTNNCAATLAVNSSCTINVKFTPTATGTRSGTLTVTDNAPGSPQTVGLSGTGASAGPQTLRPTSFTSPGTPYANPANATDGNLTTFANGIVNGDVSFEYWSGFGSAGASPTAITLKISSAANCIDPGDGNDGAEIAYSLDGGNTFHHIYAQGGLGADACSNRAQQTDVVSLPLTQDTTKVQVFAELASIHSSTHQVYDIWIEVSH